MLEETSQGMSCIVPLSLQLNWMELSILDVCLLLLYGSVTILLKMKKIFSFWVFQKNDFHAATFY